MKETAEYPGTSYIPEVEDATRRAQERRLVEEGSALWARRKEELLRQKRREQLQLRKMLAQYYPWGKPGGGAPCAATLRKKNVRLYSPEPVHRTYSSFKEENESLVKTTLLECPKLSRGGNIPEVSIPKKSRRCYPKNQTLGQEQQNTLRTEKQHKQRYRKHLDSLVAERRKAKDEEFARTRDYEKKLLEQASPWGRPGPGGAPWRDPKLLGVRFLNSMGWTDRTPRIDSRSYIDPLAVTEMNKFYDEKATHGITPDPHPGPMPSSSSSLDPNKPRYNEDVQVYKLNGGVELVPLLTNNKYQTEPHENRYLATDATRPGYTLESLKALKALSSGNREYVSELAQQINRKRERIVEEQRREQENCRRHYDTWRRLWGRPGHGAPIDHSQRTNLHNILYRPAIY